MFLIYLFVPPLFPLNKTNSVLLDFAHKPHFHTNVPCRAPDSPSRVTNSQQKRQRWGQEPSQASLCSFPLKVRARQAKRQSMLVAECQPTSYGHFSSLTPTTAHHENKLLLWTHCLDTAGRETHPAKGWWLAGSLSGFNWWWFQLSEIQITHLF